MNRLATTERAFEAHAEAGTMTPVSADYSFDVYEKYIKKCSILHLAKAVSKLKNDLLRPFLSFDTALAELRGDCTRNWTVKRLC